MLPPTLGMSEERQHKGRRGDKEQYVWNIGSVLWKQRTEKKQSHHAISFVQSPFFIYFSSCSFARVDKTRRKTHEERRAAHMNIFFCEPLEWK